MPSEISWMLGTLGFRKVEIFGGTVGKFSRKAKTVAERIRIARGGGEIGAALSRLPSRHNLARRKSLISVIMSSAVKLTVCSSLRTASGIQEAFWAPASSAKATSSV